MSSSPPSLVTFVVNAVAYSFLLIYSLLVYRKNDLSRLSSFPRFIVVACICRLIWFASEYAGYGSSADCQDDRNFVSFAGRFAQLLLFSAFLTVLFFWWEILLSDTHNNNMLLGFHLRTQQDLNSATILSSTRVPFIKTLDVLLNFWLYVVLFGLLIYKYYSCDDVVRKRVADVETITLAFFFAILAIGFLIVGIKLYQKLILRESTSSTYLQFRILTISTICVTLFFIRCILFLLHPIFGLHIDGIAQDILYPWFFYTLPEILPALIVLSFMIKKQKPRIALEDALLVVPDENDPLNRHIYRI